MSDQSKEELLIRWSKLSPTKRALLQKRLRGEVQPDSRPTAIPRRSTISPAPASFAQERLWFLHQFDPDSPFYNEPGAVWLQGTLDVVALEQSLNEIVRRHETLRTTFQVLEEQLVQIIAPTLTLTLPVVDLSQVPKASQQVEVEQLALEENQPPFNLAEGPLLRGVVLQLDPQEHVLLLSIHHIVVDTWSSDVLLREWGVLYEAFRTGNPSPLPKLPIQYADFAAWQRRWLQGDVLETQLSYWKQQLANLPVLNLPTERSHVASQTFRGKRQIREVAEALNEELEALNRQEGVTQFMSLVAAFQVLLHYYTSQEDIVVGTDVANRNRAEIEGLIGFFVNQLVLRTDLSGNPRFRELLGRVREVALAAYAHQDLPFNKLVEVLNPERDLMSMPLFRVKIVLQTPMQPLTFPHLTISRFELDNQTAKFDLLLNVWNTDRNTMKWFLEYSTDRFKASTVAQMLENFETILRTVVQQPDIRLNTLVEILSKAEQQKRILKKQEFKEVRRKTFKDLKPKLIS